MTEHHVIIPRLWYIAGQYYRSIIVEHAAAWVDGLTSFIHLDGSAILRICFRLLLGVEHRT